MPLTRVHTGQVLDTNNQLLSTGQSTAFSFVDPLIPLNINQLNIATTNPNDIGFIFIRGTSGTHNVGLFWDESAGAVRVANTTETGSTTGNITYTSNAPIAVGDITTTGNVNLTGTAGTGLVFTDGSKLQSMAYFPGRNRIINGSFRVSQYNSTSAITPTVGTYVIDMWYAALSQASKLTFQQVADAPAGAKYSTKVTVASQFIPGVADAFGFRQNIEGQNIVDLSYGTAGALTITTSFQIKSSIVGTYSVRIFNTLSTKSYVATYTISLANTWTPLTITIPGDTASAFSTDNSTGLFLDFALGAGTNLQTASTNTWLAGAYTQSTSSIQFVDQIAGSTWQLANVQLEAGSVATTFEQRLIGAELGLCRRYLPAILISDVNYLNYGSTTVGYAYYRFDTIPRVPPTSISFSNLSHFTMYGTGGSAAPSSIALQLGLANSASVTFTTLTAIGGAGAIGNTVMNNAAAYLLFTGCEL